MTTEEKKGSSSIPDPPAYPPLGSLSNILPVSATELLSYIPDLPSLGAAFESKLTSAAENLYSQNFGQCFETCNVLLDQAWEKLNTGHWKDVDVNWRYAFTLASMLKALSQCRLLNDSERNIDHADILKTCDIGLLMGQPIMDNVLARMSRKFRESFSSLRDKVSGDNTLDTEQNNSGQLPCKIARQDNDVDNDADSKTESKTVSPTLSKAHEVPHCCCPSVEMFNATFFDLQHPVVVTDAIGYWPAFTTRKWSLAYLRDIAGARTVPVEIGSRYTEDDWTQKLMTVNEFIDEYITNPKSDTKGYLAQHNLFDQISELKDDISVPVYCCLGNDEDVDINAWFGPAGTVSPLHQDPKHNFLCQVMGEKYVRLYSPDYTEHMYPHPTKLLDNTSQVDCENPDLEKFPKFKDAVYLECVLKPGDMLYIPPKHWHFVRSLSVSFSVSFWWQ
ncbi:hypothetical protein BaRGS_00038417 [Batillaria attramentaria]|uniref:JmjC domain-containing protein 5 n=1 Tax=Batillaria attramentaria TaxID=370345 RepID=A0ABD0J5S1_9CAEN